MFLADTQTCPILGPLVPLFSISKPEWVLPYLLFLFAEANVMYSPLRSTSGATPATKLNSETLD